MIRRKSRKNDKTSGRPNVICIGRPELKKKMKKHRADLNSFFKAEENSK
jgi:hypothetical protein